MTNHILVDQITMVTQNQRVLISGVCHNKLLQTGQLKITHSIISQAWRPDVRNQGVHRATLISKALGENPSLPLPASGGSWCSLACGCITPVSGSTSTWSSLCPLLFCLLMNTCHLYLQPTEESRMVSSQDL